MLARPDHSELSPLESVQRAAASWQMPGWSQAHGPPTLQPLGQRPCDPLAYGLLYMPGASTSD
jgi:hypothetical protein